MKRLFFITATCLLAVQIMIGMSSIKYEKEQQTERFINKSSSLKNALEKKKLEEQKEIEKKMEYDLLKKYILKDQDTKESFVNFCFSTFDEYQNTYVDKKDHITKDFFNEITLYSIKADVGEKNYKPLLFAFWQKEHNEETTIDSDSIDSLDEISASFFEIQKQRKKDKKQLKAIANCFWFFPCWLFSKYIDEHVNKE